MTTFPIVTNVYDSSLSLVGTFNSALEADGENIANKIAQANHILVAESDSAAIAILNDTSGTPIDKWISVTQKFPASGVALRVANFICKSVNIEIKDNRRVLRLKGPNKFYELSNRSLGNVYIAHRDIGTISASELTATTCKIIPGDADYKSDDFYNGWTLETDDGYVGIVQDYRASDGKCVLAGSWAPETNPAAAANYQIKSGVAVDDDVTQVMEFAPAGWSVNYQTGTGTATGTSFVAAEESVFEGLKTISEMSGETFYDLDTAAPTRSVRWVRTPLTNTGTFRNDINQSDFEAGIYRPIINITRKRADMDRVTRLRPYGNNKLTIALAETEVSVPAGFSVDWGQNTITNTTAESAGATIRYGDATWPAIKVVKNDDLPSTETVPETAAAVALFWAGISWLTAKAAARYEYVIETYSKNLITPGRYYDIDYNGDVDITASAYVHRVKEHVGEDGFRKTTVYLASNHYDEPKTGSGNVATMLHDFSTWARHNVSGGGLYLGAFGIPGEPVVAPGISDHGALTGLGDDDHSQYLLADGTRNLTGNLAVSASVTIDGIDISAHAADKVAHSATSDAESNPSTIIAGDANGRIRLDGLGIGAAPTGQELRLDGDLVFVGVQTISTTSGNITLSPTGDVVSTKDFYLSSGSRKIETSSGNLTINSSADIALNPAGGNVAVDGNITFVGAQTISSSTYWTLGSADYIMVSPTNSVYLRPGSDIVYIDNQLKFDAAGSITSVTGDLTLTPDDYLNLRPTLNIIKIDNELQFDAAGSITTASLGLTIAPAADIALNPAGGNVTIDADLDFQGAQSITTSAGDLTITPAVNLNVDADLEFQGAQSITTSSGNLTIAPVGDIALNPAGGNVTIDADLDFQGAQSITTSADDLTIIPAGDILLQPAGGQVLLGTNHDIEGQNWVSGFLGAEWGIDTGIGHIDARSAYFDELRVTLFSADETLVLAGSHFVSPGMGRISRDFTLPAVSSTATIYFRDSDALPDTAIFRESDWVMIRVKDTSGAGLTIAMVWGQVTGYSDLSGGDDGEQSWTWTTRSMGAVWDIAAPPTASTSDVIPEESIGIGFGQSGDGWWSVTTNDLTSGPYAQISSWYGANPYTAANRTQHVRLGDLNGISGIGHEYGLYAGISPSGPRIIVSDTDASFHQIPISLYSGTNDNAALLLYAVELNSDVETAIAPNADVSATSISIDPGTGTYFSHIDEDPSSPGADFLYATNGTSGELILDLEDISHTLTTIELEAHIATFNFVDDTCTLRAQITKASGVALTDEIKVASESTTSPSLITVPFTGVDTTASDAEWAAARLKLTWIYHVSGGNEVIKLEPNMEVGPFIAVGATLPDAYDSVNDGFWVGNDGGTYKLRIGDYDGTAMLWDGTDLLLQNAGLNISQGGVNKVKITSAAVVKMGTDIDVVADTTFVYGGATGDLRIGVDDTAKGSIFWDKSESTLSLVNSDLVIWNGAAQTVDMTAVGNVKFGEDISDVTKTGFTFTASSGDLYIGDTSGTNMFWDNSAGTLQLQEASLEITNGAPIVVQMTSAGNVKFGSNIASADTTGFYFDAANGDLRIGGLGGTLGNMFWDESIGKLSIRNNTTDVISFDGVTGDSYFAGTMEIDTNGEIVSGNTRFEQDGIFLGALSSNPSTLGGGTTTSSIKLADGLNTEYAALYGVFGGSPVGSQVYLRTHNSGTTATYYARARLYASTNDGGYGHMYVEAIEGGNSNFYSNTDQVSFDTSGFVIDQLTTDDAIFALRSTGDYSDSGQGMDSALNYFQIGKSGSTTGGALLRGASEVNHGLWLRGSANTADATELNSSRAPVILAGAVGDGGVGSGNNVVAMMDDTTTLWILKDTGEVYNDYATTMTTYDDYDDDDLILAMNRAVSGDDLTDDFGKFIQTNRSDLVRLKLLSDGGMVNSSRWQMLHNGTLVQHGSKLDDLYKRIAELEARLA